jgi:hypothetical protein
MPDLEDLEQELVKQAVENIATRIGAKKTNDPKMKDIIAIVERFIKKRELVCYGGTAINNILPEMAQFYDKKTEIPDYDFYSPNALEHAKDLADEFYENGFSEVEAKSGMHHGTYKVFVNFVGIADITQLDPTLFKNIRAEAIKVDGILYAPPNLLRMGMYLELSRPEGDVSRWEKVSKRLALLNKHHPLKAEGCTPDKLMIPFQTPKKHYKANTFNKSPTADDIDAINDNANAHANANESEEVRLFRTVRNAFIDEDLVFFGGYAISQYARYLPKRDKALFSQIPHFDVLSTDPEVSAGKVKERLEDNDFKDVVVTKHSGIGEIVPEHYEIAVGNLKVAFIYKPVACHSYNVIQVGKKQVRIASTDTMLSLYLAMIYSEKPYYDVRRILCMCKYLYDIQQRNRLKQMGLLRRFGITCYGKQETLDDIKAKKAEKYQELKRDDPEREEWFLKYSPMEYFEHTYDAKKHKLTIKRSPNAKKSPSAKSPSAKSPKSTDRSPKSIYRSPKSIYRSPKSPDRSPKSPDRSPKSPDKSPKTHPRTPTPIKTPKKTKTVKKTKKTKKRKTKKANAFKQIFKLIT